MAANVLSISDYSKNQTVCNWRENLFEELNKLLDEMEQIPMNNLCDITGTIFLKTMPQKPKIR